MELYAVYASNRYEGGTIASIHTTTELAEKAIEKYKSNDINDENNEFGGYGSYTIHKRVLDRVGREIIDIVDNTRRGSTNHYVNPDGTLEVV